MTEGAKTYWKKRASVIVILRSKTERFRPVEEADVEPRQVLQREEEALQQQYAKPS